MQAIWVELSSRWCCGSQKGGHRGDGSRDETLGSPVTGTLPISHRCSPDICEKHRMRGVVVDTLGLG